MTSSKFFEGGWNLKKVFGISISCLKLFQIGEGNTYIIELILRRLKGVEQARATLHGFHDAVVVEGVRLKELKPGVLAG